MYCILRKIFFGKQWSLYFAQHFLRNNVFCGIIFSTSLEPQNVCVYISVPFFFLQSRVALRARLFVKNKFSWAFSGTSGKYLGEGVLIFQKQSFLIFFIGGQKSKK